MQVSSAVAVAVERGTCHRTAQTVEVSADRHDLDHWLGAKSPETAGRRIEKDVWPRSGDSAVAGRSTARLAVAPLLSPAPIVVLTSVAAGAAAASTRRGSRRCRSTRPPATVCVAPLLRRQVRLRSATRRRRPGRRAHAGAELGNGRREVERRGRSAAALDSCSPRPPALPPHDPAHAGARERLVGRSGRGRSVRELPMIAVGRWTLAGRSTAPWPVGPDFVRPRLKRAIPGDRSSGHPDSHSEGCHPCVFGPLRPFWASPRLWPALDRHRGEPRRRPGARTRRWMTPCLTIDLRQAEPANPACDDLPQFKAAFLNRVWRFNGSVDGVEHDELSMTLDSIERLPVPLPQPGRRVARSGHDRPGLARHARLRAGWAAGRSRTGWPPRRRCRSAGGCCARGNGARTRTATSSDRAREADPRVVVGPGRGAVERRAAAEATRGD